VNTNVLAALGLFAFLSCVPAAPIEIIPPEMHGAVQPQIAVSPNGRVHVTFGKDNAVYYTSAPDGRTFSVPVKVAELDKLALKRRRGPRIAVTNELVLVTAISHGDGNLHAWTSSDQGRTWKESQPLNSSAGFAREGLHATIGNGLGLVGTVWLDGRNKATELRGRFSRDGGKTWDEDRTIYRSPDGHICECCHPSLAIAENGEISVMWRNWLGGSRDLYRLVSRDGGKTFGNAEKLGTGTWKFNACPMDGGSVAYATDGHWLAAWRREGAIFSSTAQMPEVLLVKAGTQPVVGFAGATALTIWESQGGLELQRKNEPPKRIADAAAEPSIAGGKEAACLVWESGTGPMATLMFDRVK
jgi:hypothetical protein